MTELPIEDWKSILRAVRAPIGFYGLALLVLGGICIAIVVETKLSTTYAVAALAGFGILVSAVLAVASIFIWKRPESFVYSARETLISELYGSNEKTMKPDQRKKPEKLRRTNRHATLGKGRSCKE